MHLRITKVIFTVLSVITLTSVCPGAELKSRYTTIVYDKEAQLRKFNEEVMLGSLSYLIRNRRGITVADEVRNKVDVIVERVETILEMFPKVLNFKIALLSSATDVQRIYKNKYGDSLDYIAFYSPKGKTVFVSVSDISLGILAHELAHVIIDSYFGISPPVKIHEVLAQYVETHLED